MRKLTLLTSILLLSAAFVTQSWAGTFKFKSSPHVPFTSTQTVQDVIYVPTKVKMTNVRIGVYIKSVWYSSLRITLISPGGAVRLKTESATGTNYAGSIGSERSYCTFQDGAAAMGATGQPFDRLTAPAQALNILNGTLTQGWWTIKVEDFRLTYANPQNEGYLESWAISFNSVVIEPEVDIWRGTKSGSQIVGQINGQFGSGGAAQIPNGKGDLELCTVSGEPNVTLGRNGDAIPFIVANTGYPTHTIGSIIPGFSTPGRWKITVNIATNNAPPSPTLAAPTSDISIYWGKVATFTPPLQNPPSPPNANGVTSALGWPRGSGNWTTTLLPGGLSGLHGGVRLSACPSYDAPPWNIPSNDIGGYIDVAFDDRALNSITQADVSPFGDGAYGPYKPEQPLSGLNGNLLEGLYYLTVYDTYGENFLPFGHVRILNIEVKYLAGGGETENPNTHQGIAGPLMGVPIPGAITGLPIGYLADIVGTLPPYSIHAKDQDPILMFWGSQKMGPRSAVGFERIQAVDPSNYIPPTGVVYDGPFAYPGSLDATPGTPGLRVNADEILVPPNKYKLRMNIVQARYDDETNDNEIEGSPFEVTNTSLGYYGDLVQAPNIYISAALGGNYMPLPLYPSPNANSSAIGAAFSLFKFPATKLTSVDYKMDLGQANQTTAWKATVRMSIYKCAGGFVGAPTGAAVAKSPNINLSEYHQGNWRSFPIQPCDASGNIIINSWSADLAPGTYVVMLDNVDATNNHLVWPYTYGQMPFMKDRFRDFQFSDNFGPLGSFASTGTRLSYASTNITNPPITSLGQIWTGGTNNFGNFTWPMRLNFTNMSDFSINYVNFSGSGVTESVSLTTAPFSPRVYVSSMAPQGNVVKDFNARLEIYSGSNRIYISDRMYGLPTYPGVTPYGTVAVPMDSWTPPAAGEYLVKAFFSRNPDDQNPVNDMVQYYLRITAVRAILLTGNNVNPSDLAKAIDLLKDKGMSVDVMNQSSANLTGVKNASVYFVGDLDESGRTAVQTAMDNGNDIASIYSTSLSPGKVLRNFDYALDVNRGNIDYNAIDYPRVTSPSVEAAPVKTPDVKITTKEDVLNLIRSAKYDVQPVTAQPLGEPPAMTNATMNIPAPISSPYGDISYQYEQNGSTAITYVARSSRKSAPIVDAVTPRGYLLGQNYPNPFNPSTVISFTVPEASIVTLRVLDMLGREVMTVFSGKQDAGTVNATWKGTDNNGNQVASGSYLYRLDATPVNGGQPWNQIRKMTLAK